MFEMNGAPDRIRTHDPQIRRLGPEFEKSGFFCKPAHFGGITDQCLRSGIANQNPPDLTASEGRNPATLRGVTGQNEGFRALCGTQGQDYRKGAAGATGVTRWRVHACLMVEVLA